MALLVLSESSFTASVLVCVRDNASGVYVVTDIVCRPLGVAHMQVLTPRVVGVPGGTGRCGWTVFFRASSSSTFVTRPQASSARGPDLPWATAPLADNDTSDPITAPDPTMLWPTFDITFNSCW